MSRFNFSCWENVSQDSVTEIGWIVDHPNDPNFDTRGNGYATAVIVLLFFLTGVPWNLFVICTIVGKKLYKNPTIMLLLNLAIANLLLGLIFMPFTIITGFSGHYLFGQSDEVRCRLCQTGILLVLFPMVSVHTITLMAVDRYMYLQKPLKYRVLITPHRMLLAVVTIWIFCIILSLPPLFGFGAIAFSYVVSTCAPLLIGTSIAPNYYYMTLLAVEVVLVLSVLFAMYICIMFKIRKSIIAKFQRAVILSNADLQRHPSKNKQSKSESERKSAEFRLISLFSAIVTANLFTWLPMIALVLTGAIAGLEHIPTVMYNLAFLSYTSETVIHPILQAYLIREVREIMSGFLKPCRKKTEHEATTHSGNVNVTLATLHE